jgi:hypothetical protein
MTQAVGHDPQMEVIESKNTGLVQIWKPAAIVAVGWVISNIISYTVADWLMNGTAGVDFEPRLGTALFMGVLGLLAGFSLSVAFWVSQDNFIGVHAFAYTFIVAIFSATIAYVPDGLYIFPLLLVGLYIGMKWAKPKIAFWYILASFIFWVVMAASLGLLVISFVYSNDKTPIQLFWQCVWSGFVGLFGSAFMFWQMQIHEDEPDTIKTPSKTAADDWQRIQGVW